MKAGRLRHVITLQRNEPTKNDLGEPTPNWVDYADCDAEIMPLRGREFFDAQQVNAELTTRVRIRWVEGVKAEHRVIFEGRTLEIASPPMNTDEKNRELVLMCKEVG